LTALTSAIYYDENGPINSAFEANGGLFVKNRFSMQRKIKIPSECLAFQIG
jgi:hypothetical protein